MTELEMLIIGLSGGALFAEQGRGVFLVLLGFAVIGLIVRNLA